MDLQQKIRALPEPVQDYLYGEELSQAVEQVFERHRVDFEKRRGLLKLLQRAIVREVALTELASEASALTETGGDAKALARDFAGYCLLPLDKWLGDVDGAVRALGGDPKTYPEFRIQIERRTPEQAAQEVAKESAVQEADARTSARLQGVLQSFLSGIRTADQTREVLTRAEKIGGLGYDDATAERVLEELREESRTVVIDQAKATPTRTLADPAAPAAEEGQPPAPAKPKADFATITPEDEMEIEKIKTQVLPDKGVEKADETARRIQASIDEIYLASGLATEDEAMTKRIKTVVANRLRDVRDQMETLEIMVQPKELGGLGLSQDAARALLNAIQAKLRAVHEEHAAEAASAKTEWVEKEQEKKVEGEARAKQDDQSDLERLYQSIVSKSPKALKNAPASPAPAPAAVPAAAPAMPAVPDNLPIATSNPVPPELRAPAVVPLPAAPVPPPTPAIAAPPLTIVRPTPGVPVAPQIMGGMDAPKPRMEDVKPVAKLTGPVEELRAITIVDFRRLSKDPVDACAKIKDKIDILAEQSYTRRTESIAAWGASEVVRTYLELMGEGLNGLPLKDAIAARQAAKKPYLTPEEFQAVAALSRQLRY